jgi:Fic family protein
MMFHRAGNDGTCLQPPPPSILKEFHRTATLFLLLKPGELREEEVVVKKGEVIVHEPPPFSEVEYYLSEFHEKLESRWQTLTGQELAGYCLWFINWVHPFKNGNGRTARAFSYAVLSLKLGFILPGEKTVIDLIMNDPTEYYDALQVADQAFKASGEPNLEPIVDLVDRLLAEQLSSI